MSRPDDIIEQGAETILMPEGGGYAIAIWDEVYPDRIVRCARMMEVDKQDLDKTLYTTEKVIWRSANPA